MPLPDFLNVSIGLYGNCLKIIKFLYSQFDNYAKTLHYGFSYIYIKKKIQVNNAKVKKIRKLIYNIREISNENDNNQQE